MKLLEMSGSATILILVIVSLRALSIHKLPKKTFLLLWAVALFRLLIPFSISSPMSIYNYSENTPQIATIRTAVAHTTFTNLGTTHSFSNQNAAISPLFIIWLCGMVMLAAFFIITHLLGRREYKCALPICDPFIQEWIAAHHLYRKVQVRKSDRIHAPLTYGVFHPIILIPKTLAIENSSQLNYILTHEYMHIKHFDILLKYVLVAALCIHWFNPLVWVMYILANRDIELICDESVVRIHGVNTKTKYALTLIELEEKRSHLTPLCNHFSKNSIEERINFIMKTKKTTMIGIVIALAMIIGVSAAFATSSSSQIAPKYNLSDMLSISQSWGNSLKTRNGKLRYDVMTKKMKETFRKQQEEKGNPNGWNIGVSSPWVVSFDVTLGDKFALITYKTTTSDRQIYIFQERIGFTMEDGKLLVDSSEETVLYLQENLYHKALDIQKNVDNKKDLWRLEPSSVALRYMHSLGFTNGEITIPWNPTTHTLTYKKDNGEEVLIELYQPLGSGTNSFWAVYSYSIGDQHFNTSSTMLVP